jgi:hypothetical protein
MTPQTCPICNAEVQPNERYPKYVCEHCAVLATSLDGRPLVFSNADMSGGFITYYRDSNEVFGSHECFIKGTKCYADEARFGGIVIQVVAISGLEKLVGVELKTIAQGKEFVIQDVTAEFVIVVPVDGKGKSRSVRRDRIESLLTLAIPKEEIRKRVLREYPDSRHASYLAAIVHHLRSRIGETG